MRWSRALNEHVARLRGEVALLRNDLVEKVDGQLRLERTETTRALGSDIEALQREIRRLAVSAGVPDARTDADRDEGDSDRGGGTRRRVRGRAVPRSACRFVASSAPPPAMPALEVPPLASASALLPPIRFDSGTAGRCGAEPATARRVTSRDATGDASRPATPPSVTSLPGSMPLPGCRFRGHRARRRHLPLVRHPRPRALRCRHSRRST